MLNIERIELVPVAVPRETGVINQHVIVRIEAAGGAIGYGEMSDLSHVPMYQFDLPELERSLNELLVGDEVHNLSLIEDKLQRFYPDEGHVYSRSGLVRQGIDLALHDLLARYEGKPVYTLLGGKLRDRFKVCYPIFRMRFPDQVPAVLDGVQAKLEQGFDLFRVYVGANPVVDELFLSQFAERFGGRASIKSLDFSNLLDWRRAWQQTKRLSQLVDFMMVESPAPRNDLSGLAEFRRRSSWPISEHVYHLQHGWQLLRSSSVDILNISPYVLGGLRACLRVAALAEAANASVLIGTTQELNLGTAAVAHLGAVLRVLDYPCDSTGPMLYTQDVTKDRIRYEAGFLVVPDKPGLGVDVDEERLREMRNKARWTFGVDLTGIVDRTTPSSPEEKGAAGK